MLKLLKLQHFSVIFLLFFSSKYSIIWLNIPITPTKGGEQMVKLYNQISFSDICKECKDAFQSDKPKFLELLTQHLDLSSLILQSFYWSYYKILGRDRKYSLLSLLAALILQKILGIPTVTLLIIFLELCREAREFCGLEDVPDNSQFTRFNKISFQNLKIFLTTLWILQNLFAIR